MRKVPQGSLKGQHKAGRLFPPHVEFGKGGRVLVPL